MDQLVSIIPHFPHKEPDGYSYETREFRSNVAAIWLYHHYDYIYSGGKPVATIWGFYNVRTKCYYAPISSTKQGNKVEISQTTPYSAMLRKLNPLETVLYA